MVVHSCKLHVSRGRTGIYHSCSFPIVIGRLSRQVYISGRAVVDACLVFEIGRVKVRIECGSFIIIRVVINCIIKALVIAR